MRRIAVVCSAVIGVALLMSPAFAQEKTVRACQAEWRANKADNQAKGITEKAYVAKCRGGDSAAKPAPAPWLVGDPAGTVALHHVDGFSAGTTSATGAASGRAGIYCPERRCR